MGREGGRGGERNGDRKGSLLKDTKVRWKGLGEERHVGLREKTQKNLDKKTCCRHMLNRATHLHQM